MSDKSPRLGLPYIAPAQAQKHVTHNEALQRLDAVTQLSFVEVGLQEAPAVPQEGDLYVIGDAPTGLWSGQAGQIAYWAQNGWMFFEPRTGWRGWDQATSSPLTYSDSGWMSETPSTENLPGVGIATTSDPTNKLSVASDATLFSHAGGGHQLKLNKALASDTASLLYQSDYTGHAEMGLTGDNNFHIKTSADGTTWTEAMVIDGASGLISGSAVQTSATDTTEGRIARADYAYGPGNLIGTVASAAGTPTGAVLERGANANGEYVRFADGTQICSIETATFTRETSNSLLFAWTPPAEFLAGSARTTSYCIGNSSSDWVDIAPMDLGILRQFPTSDTMRITRNAGAPNFPSTGEIRNVRIVSWGRWS